MDFNSRPGISLGKTLKNFAYERESEILTRVSIHTPRDHVHEDAEPTRSADTLTPNELLILDRKPKECFKDRVFSRSRSRVDLHFFFLSRSCSVQWRLRASTRDDSRVDAPISLSCRISFYITYNLITRRKRMPLQRGVIVLHLVDMFDRENRERSRRDPLSRASRRNVSKSRFRIREKV